MLAELGGQVGQGVHQYERHRQLAPHGLPRGTAAGGHGKEGRGTTPAETE